MPKNPTKRPWPADRSSGQRPSDRPLPARRRFSDHPSAAPAFRRPPPGDGPTDRDAFRPGLADRLVELDAELTRLLARRADLYGKLLAKERGKRPDKGVEPRLWTLWEDRLRENPLDPKLWRQIFSLVNSLSFELAGAGAATENFVLAPRRGDIDVELPGPTAGWQAQALLFLASAVGQPLTLEGVNLSDPLFELCKALNQAQSGLTWEPGLVNKPAAQPLTLDGAALFCGRDAFNFYLPLCLALGPGGRTKLSGAAELKSLDLLPLGRLLARLGGRMSNLDPKSKGLPVRLESGGIATDALVLDEAELTEIPLDFARALALTAWSYPRGLTVRWPAAAGRRLHEALRPVVSLLESLGVAARLEAGRLTVPAGRPALPERPALFLDPLLCAALLAMPQAARRERGRVRLTGAWPARSGDAALADAALALLRAAGAQLDVSPDAVTATAGPAPERPVLDPGQPALFPLAAALAASSPSGAHLLVPASLPAEARRAAVALLTRLGATFSQESDRIVIDRPAVLQPGGFGEPWLAPDAPFALALALVGLRIPGLALANPGLVAAAWPAFWTVYAKLPAVTAQSLIKPEEEAADAGKTRRRIRVDGDSDPGMEIEELTGLMRARRDEAKTLLMTEDPANGVFHHDRIFTARQDVLRLETEIMIRRNKINRLRLGEAPPGMFF